MALMKLKCLEGVEIDPETCPIEELERMKDACKREEDYWNTMQLSAKTFINSVYGVFGTSYFNLANIDIAESITLQGQDLIKYSVIKVDDYFKNMWHLDYEGHKRVSDIMINEYGFKDFDRENFERMARTPLQFNSLQVYGDSVAGDSRIQLKYGDNYFTEEIQELFNEFCDSDSGDKIRVKVGSKYLVGTYDPETDKPIYRGIDYVMRHKTKKRRFRICLDGGNSVVVTEDHSIMVLKDDNLVEVAVKDLHIDDKLIVYANRESVVQKEIHSIIYVGCDDEYVYDLCVFADKDIQHTFFANNILVHNTDSVSGDTVVVTKNHPNGISIERLHGENAEYAVEFGDNHESVLTDDMVLNYSGNEIYLAPVSRIIRHKVTKDKYLLYTKYSGNSVECTADHSLIVYRKEDDTGQYWSHVIKPHEMKEGDLVVTCKNDSYTFEEATCEKIGEYNDEYVYDIEMDDLTSTFVANGILVHNSAYLTMEPLLNLYGIPDDQMVKFCLAVYKAVMEKYLDDKFDEYAAHFHCKENLEKFELEKISRAVIMLAKKNYMCDVAWIDSGVFFEQGHHITYTGYDVVKGATTNFCREEMKNFTNFCFQKIHEGRIPTQGECVQLLRGMKQRFAMQSPNEIGKTVSISEYEKFVKADNKPQIEYFNYSLATVMEASPSSDKVAFASVPGNWKKDDIVSFYTNIGGQVSKVTTLKIAAVHGNVVTFSSLYANIPNGCEAINENRKTPIPIHVRAAAVYNNTILVKNRKYLSKYELLKSGDKIRYYYTSEDEVFGFIPDNFPYEFAPPVDVDVQFDKSLLSPINRIIVALGLNEVPPSLTYSVGLF